MTARSTTLTMMARHCPHAVTLYEDPEVQRLDLPVIGIAAHDVLHALGQRRTVDTACERLIAEGRTGVDKEGPLDPDRVLEGRRLALDWARDRHLPADAMYELGLAVDERWQPVGYTDPAAWLRARIDYVHVTTDLDDDGAELVVARVADFKSSWQAGDSDLSTLQRKIQAVLIWLALPKLCPESEVHALDLVIHNLRTGTDYTRRLWLPDDEAILRDWQAEIAIAVRAVSRRPRTPNPGPGCVGCPYAHACAHRANVTGLSGPEATPRDVATAYATARAQAGALESTTKALVNRCDAGRIVFADGSAVGFIPVTRRAVKRDAVRDMWREFAGDATPSEDLIVSFLRDMGGPTIGQVGKLAKALAEDKAERDALTGRWLTETTAARWRVAKPATFEAPGEP